MSTLPENLKHFSIPSVVFVFLSDPDLSISRQLSLRESLAFHPQFDIPPFLLPSLGPDSLFPFPLPRSSIPDRFD